jgi:hypothetical protein
MSLRLVKRHGQLNWYIRGSVRGIAVDKSTLTDNEATTDAIRIKEENRLLNRSVFGEKASVSFVEAAVQYMEQGGETRFLQPSPISHHMTADIHSQRGTTPNTVILQNLCRFVGGNRQTWLCAMRTRMSKTCSTA